VRRKFEKKGFSKNDSIWLEERSVLELEIEIEVNNTSSAFSQLKAHWESLKYKSVS
jgi:hypothetical protein